MLVGTITLEEARRRYPDAVEAAEEALRKSKSKERGSPVETFVWTFESCVRIDGHEPPLQYLEDKIADRVRRTSTCLVARKGRWRHQVLIENPPEVEAWHRGVLTKQLEDQRAYDALSEEEKDRQCIETLELLAGSSGFMVFAIPVDD